MLNKWFLFLFLIGPGSINAFEDLVFYDTEEACIKRGKHLHKFYSPELPYRLKYSCVNSNKREELKNKTFNKD